MSHVYRCQQCDLTCEVVAGPIGLSGEAIHCPRCGGLAVEDEGGIAFGPDVVRVELGADGASTREIPGLAGDDTRKVASEALMSAFHDTERLSAVTEDDGQTARRDVTPAGTPGLALTDSASESVTAIPTVDVGPPATPSPSPPRAPQMPRWQSLAEDDEPAGEPPARLGARGGGPDTDQGMVSPMDVGARYTPPRSVEGVDDVVLGQAASDLAVVSFVREASGSHPRVGRRPSDRPDPAYQGDAPGRAWRADVIKQALTATGEDSGPSPRVKVGVPTAELEPLPEARKLKIEVPESLTPPGLSHGAAQLDALDSGPERATPFSGPPPAVGVRPVPLRPRRARQSPVLLVLLICVAVVAVGVVVGVIWYGQTQHGAPPPSTETFTPFSLDARTQDQAFRRWTAYGLAPLDRASPFEVAYRLDRVDYPTALALSVRLENRSDRDVSLIRLAAIWYLIHGGPEVVRREDIPLDRVISVAEPLEPGQAVVARIELNAEAIPGGEPDESFLWLEVTAADSQLEIFFDGGVLMLDIPVE